MKKAILILGLVIPFALIGYRALGYSYSPNPFTNSQNMQRESLNRMMQDDFQRRRTRDEENLARSNSYSTGQKNYYTEKVTTFCSSGEYDKAKCDKYCKNLKSYNGNNDLCGAPVSVKKQNTKSIKADLLQQEKQQWKIQRQEALDKVKQQKEELKEKREKFTAEKCAKIQEKVQSKTSEFNSEKEKHTTVYTNLVNRINKFIARFDEKKLDTSTIKNHLAELQTKIDKFKEDYAAYIAKLGESKNLTCGHSEGEFKGTLLEARTLLQTVHADAADIRTYARTTIFDDIKNLKAQLPKENTVDNSAANNDTNATGAENQQ